MTGTRDLWSRAWQIQFRFSQSNRNFSVSVFSSREKFRI